APSILQLAVVALELGKLVSEVQAKAVANVEIRVATLRLGVPAVVGLSGVGDKVLKVAGVVDGVRPHIVRLQREPVPGIHVQAGLQRIVDGVGRSLFLVHIEKIGEIGARYVEIDAVGTVEACDEAIGGSLSPGRALTEIKSRNLRLSRLVDI